jgi:hypothetical protein
VWDVGKGKPLDEIHVDNWLNQSSSSIEFIGNPNQGAHVWTLGLLEAMKRWANY